MSTPQEAQELFLQKHSEAQAWLDIPDAYGARIRELANIFGAENKALGAYVSLYDELDPSFRDSWFEVAALSIDTTKIKGLSDAITSFHYLNASTGFVSTLESRKDKQNIKTLQEKMVADLVARGVSTDDTELVQLVDEKMFPNKYIVETGVGLNFAVDTQIGKQYGLDNVNDYKSGLELFRQKLVLEKGWTFRGSKNITPDVRTKIDEYISPENTLESTVSNWVSKQVDTVKEEIENLQRSEAMQNKSDNIRFAPVASKDGKGLMMGVYNVQGDNSKDSILIGTMLKDGMPYIESQEKFAGTSLSYKLVEYLQSHRVQFGLSHEYLKDAHDDAIDRQGRGVLNPKMSDWNIINWFQSPGLVELNHALKPLLSILNKTAQEKSVEFLSPEETDTVVDDFLHNQDRWYQMFPQFVQPFLEKMDNFKAYHELPSQLQVLDFN